jgi:GT2 family glycosyltransferase
MPSVSVVIPSHQRRESLRRLLRALDAQSLPAEQFEVVVCLDGCTDGSDAMLASLRPSYALRARELVGGGRAAACNEAIRAARGEVLVILDDDMEPGPRLLEVHLAAHRRAEERGERLVLMGAVPVRADGGTNPAARYVAGKFGSHLRKLARVDHRLALRDFYTGNCSIRRDTIESVGLFNEGFRDYGNEDLDLYVRLRRARVTIRFDPDAEATQHYEKDIEALMRDGRSKGRTAVLLARLHPEVKGELQLGSWRRTPWRLRLPVALLLAVTPVVPSLPSRLSSLLKGVGRSDEGVGRLAFEVALAYAYWLGVRDAEHAAR